MSPNLPLPQTTFSSFSNLRSDRRYAKKSMPSQGKNQCFVFHCSLGSRSHILWPVEGVCVLILWCIVNGTGELFAYGKPIVSLIFLYEADHNKKQIKVTHSCCPGEGDNSARPPNFIEALVLTPTSVQMQGYFFYPCSHL